MILFTILSNFKGITSERFFDEYVYQLMVMRRHAVDKETYIFPISVEISYEQAFNGFIPEEFEIIKLNIREAIYASHSILLCIDRGITDEMIELLEKTNRNHSLDLMFFTLHPDNTAVGNIIKVLNEDSSLTFEKKINLLKIVRRKLEKSNSLIYQKTGDLSNYRKTFFKEIAEVENEALLTMAAALEKKIERDTNNGKRNLIDNPFEVLDNLKKQVIKRKAS